MRERERGKGLGRLRWRIFGWIPLVSLLLVIGIGDGFYVPGIAPVDYQDGDALEVIGNKLVSPFSKLPYDLYSVAGCRPPLREEFTEGPKLNVGMILTGERAVKTPYKIYMKVPVDCKLLCEIDLTEDEVAILTKRIKASYRVRLNLDSLPVVVKFMGVSPRSHDAAYSFGYPLGNSAAAVLLNNHLNFLVKYHPTSDGSRVVGFEVDPTSTDAVEGCTSDKPLELKPGKVRFTYSVVFEESPILWATRWDAFTKPSAGVIRLEWFSVLKSASAGGLLALAVALVIFRTVRKDVYWYTELDMDDAVEEITGWKNVQGDVFRPPGNLEALSILYGTGAQVAAGGFGLFMFALLGLLRPSRRGSLLIFLLDFWVLTSAVAGFVSTKFYLSLKGNRRGYVAIGSWFAFPSLVFTVFLSVNTLVSLQGSSGAVPFFYLVLLLFLWFGVSLPLVMLGSWLASRTSTFSIPVKPTQIERQTKPLSHWNQALPLIASIIPFGTIYFEFYNVLQSIWHSQVFRMFGFVFTASLLLALTCAELAIIVTYLTLNNEEHHWWWRTYLACSLSGFHAYVFSFYYLFTTFSSLNLPSAIIFLSYMLVVCTGFGLVNGFFGMFGAIHFTRFIYASVHAD